MGRENDLSEASLPRVSDVFKVDKETVLTERLFAKDSHHPISPGPEPVSQKLAAGVIGFDSCFEVSFALKQQGRIDPAFRCERQNLVAGEDSSP